MSNDYNIFKKVLFVFTTINNPLTVLLDKLGLKENFFYRTNKGIKFIARAKSTDINEAVAILSGKEYPENILNISSKKNPIIIDAGAHIGLFSLYVKHINPSVKIYAIEPQEENITNMQKNFSLNNIKGATILKYALSSKKGKAKLWSSAREFDIATISVTRKRSSEDNYYLVKTNTLEGMVIDNRITEIDVLKMDIEGVEYQVLKKDINLIAQNVERLLVEYHTDSDLKVKGKIITMMVQNNFKLIFEHRHILGFVNCKLNKVSTAK